MRNLVALVALAGAATLAGAAAIAPRFAALRTSTAPLSATAPRPIFRQRPQRKPRLVALRGELTPQPAPTPRKARRVAPRNRANLFLATLVSETPRENETPFRATRYLHLNAADINAARALALHSAADLRRAAGASAWSVVSVSPADAPRKPHYKPARLVPRGPSGLASSLESKAVDYAAWLARRDAIALPDAIGRADIQMIWNDGRRESRARAVTFGNGVAAVTIPIPNWDFVPAPPIAETLPA